MLENLDKELFLFLNSLNSPFWDQIMYSISGKIIWIPLYLAILVTIGVKYRKRFPLILLFIILAVALADQSSVHLFKNVFQRLRPCHDPELEGLVHLVNGRCGGLYGFVSSHAANSFNVAALSLMFIKKRWYSVAIIIWASLVGYSRVYLGVHFPGDVICGAVLGSLVGWGVYKLYDLTETKILFKRTPHAPLKGGQNPD
ncbi:MAG TPA: phosphatase PAP2 family protein [Bacteroidales bacterium]|nr:phosphatase PAP2 family protein [Bacteroidales bacterium]HPF03015.1 phosphatase PAP2 family protein [Bacteroidales bacterium]HPJ59960.1 phosphatase PAP2 family protein [Bacteroidales bacterium]HPR13075.1 phosphatase PAP2 family protein [Bacteroidales bacterium]HRW85695.1 phosphatase PAP2 family protein [Bacteroidales bacterium]